MIKKYGWQYFFACIGILFLGIIWPVGFFTCYMFNDVKDPIKQKLINRLNIISILFLLLEISYLITTIISNLFDKGII